MQAKCGNNFSFSNTENVYRTQIQNVLSENLAFDTRFAKVSNAYCIANRWLLEFGWCLFSISAHKYLDAFHLH